MVTVPEATEKIIKRSRYLSEAMSKDIINLSSLARYIKPELEEMLVKNISQSSVIMALKRLKPKLKPHLKYKNLFKSPPTMLTRSNLITINLNNSENLNKKYSQILDLNNGQKHFLLLSKNISETTIIASQDLEEKIKNLLGEEKINYQLNKLSSITISLPKEALQTPGIFYFFLKSLAWEGVNIIEVVSSYLEFTMIFEEKEVNKAFSILKSLFVE